MWQGTDAFNGDLGKWDTAKVTAMGAMFEVRSACRRHRTQPRTTTTAREEMWAGQCGRAGALRSAIALFVRCTA